MTEEMNDQVSVRREKMQQLIDLGIDPFGAKFERTAYSDELVKEWDEFSKEELEEKENDSKTVIAGRLNTL